MAAVAAYTACLIHEWNILLMGTLSQEYEHNAVMQFWLLFHGSRAHIQSTLAQIWKLSEAVTSHSVRINIAVSHGLNSLWSFTLDVSPCLNSVGHRLLFCNACLCCALDLALYCRQGQKRKKLCWCLQISLRLQLHMNGCNIWNCFRFIICFLYYNNVTVGLDTDMLRLSY